MKHPYQTIFISAFFIAILSLSSLPTFGKDTAHQERGRMERIAQKNLGRDIAFKFHPYFFGLTGMRLDQFSIAENEQYLIEHPYLDPWTMKADSVEVKYNPLAIFIGRISVRHIEILNPQVQFYIDRLGRTNFDDLIQRQRKNRFSNWIRTHRVGIKNMQLTIMSELMSTQPIQYFIEDINVDIRNLIKKKVAPISVTARTPGAPNPNVKISGTIGPIVSIARIEDSPMNIHFEVSDAPLDFELAKLPDELMQNKIHRRSLVLPESGTGNIVFDFIGSTSAGLDATGTISASDVVLATINKEVKGVPFDVDMDISYHFSLAKQLAEIKHYSIHLNDAEIEVAGYVENIIDDPTANLSLKSNNMDLVKFNDIYPFVSRVNKIKPVDGHADINLDITGSMKSGFNLTGSIALNSLQVATLDGREKGSTLNASIDFNEGVTYKFHENEISYNNIELNIANNKIQFSGNIKNATQIERELSTTIRSDAIDVKSIQAFFPFYNKFIPPSASYDGVFTFEAQAEGNMDSIEIKGGVDLSDLDFVLPQFAKKQNNSRFDVTFTAGINKQFEFYARSSYVIENGGLDNATLYISAIEYLLGGKNLTPKAKKYLTKIDPHGISFAKSIGSLTYKDIEHAELSLEVLDLSSSIHTDVALYLQGTIDITDFDIDLKGELVLPEESYQSIIALNPQAKRYLRIDSDSQERKLVLPIKLGGSITEPRFSSPSLIVEQEMISSI